MRVKHIVTPAYQKAEKVEKYPPPAMNEKQAQTNCLLHAFMKIANIK